MIRSTFHAFETAKRALSASQAGLDVVGQNISNASTPGYTRQRVDQASISSGGYATKYQIRNGSQAVGQGAIVLGVSQIRDPYLDTRYRNEAASFGELYTKSQGLEDLQNVLDEISKDGLSYMLEELVNELTKLQADPNSEEILVVVRNLAKQFTQSLNKKASELQTVLDNQIFDLNAAVTGDVNSVLQQIAYLNARIREDNMYGNPSNELNDQRNLLIDQLSEMLPIKVVRTPEKVSDDLTIERISIVLVDSSTAPASEFTLVDSGSYNGLKVNENADGTVSIALVEGGTDFPLHDDITASISGGAIKGYIDMINGIGAFAGSGDNSYRGVQYYMKALDAYALQFATLMNATNSISFEESQNSGGDIAMHPDKNLFVSSNGGAITAASISISDIWMNEPYYFTISKQFQSLDDEWLKDENGDYVYDPDTNEKVRNPLYQTDNILKFKELLSETDVAFSITNGDGNKVSLYRGTFSGFLTSLQASDLGLDKSTTDSMLKASNTIISGYADQRDSISAVSADEEAINMMVYQNYYNAAARYMTVIDEALGTIIQGMGVVGR